LSDSATERISVTYISQMIYGTYSHTVGSKRNLDSN